MLRWIKSHLHDNKGDANVSKMTIIAIAFVVGAILLTLTTSAFRNPINRWFSNVTAQWFDSTNGEFNRMDSPFANYERRENGTLKGVVYRAYYGDSYYEIDMNMDLIQHGIYNDIGASYIENGRYKWTEFGGGHTEISADGTTITVDGYETFVAYIPD